MDACWQNMSLLFNTLSRFVITFYPRSKGLLISWLQSPSAVILEHKKINSVTLSIASPSICHEVMGMDAMILVFWMLSFKPVFLLSFYLHQEALDILLTHILFSYQPIQLSFCPIIPTLNVFSFSLVTINGLHIDKSSGHPFSHILFDVFFSILYCWPLHSSRKLTPLYLDSSNAFCCPSISHSWVPLTIIPSNTGVPHGSVPYLVSF